MRVASPFLPGIDGLDLAEDLVVRREHLELVRLLALVLHLELDRSRRPSPVKFVEPDELVVHTDDLDLAVDGVGVPGLSLPPSPVTVIGGPDAVARLSRLAASW